MDENVRKALNLSFSMENVFTLNLVEDVIAGSNLMCTIIKPPMKGEIGVDKMVLLL